MKKVKKAFMGLAVEAARKSPMGLIGVGADKILKKSGTARELAGSLGMGGKLLKQYYDKEDSKDKKTGSEQTTQVVAKRDGGMVRGGRAEIKGTRPAKLT
jgi:DNA topoisomerase IB